MVDWKVETRNLHLKWSRAFPPSLPPPPPREVLPCISHVVHIGICPTSSTGLVFAPFWSEHRRVASKFRIGNHNLRIETGRFTIPKTPEDLRICDYCNLNSVENKMHILFHCDLYNDLRKTLFIKINDRNTLFTIYKIHDKVCFVFNNTDSHIYRLTANFVFQAFERRKKQLILPFHYIFISLNLSAVYCYFNRYKMIILNKLVVVGLKRGMDFTHERIYYFNSK